MRAFTLLASAVLAACGVLLVVTGNPAGFFVAGFFGLCFLLAIVEPRLPAPHVSSFYRLRMTREEVACVHPLLSQESIRWADVQRVWYVTTSDGPRLPDEWILFEGETNQCSIPIEAEGFDRMWDELEARFEGFDYEPLIRGGTTAGKHLCWERQRE